MTATATHESTPTGAPLSSGSRRPPLVRSVPVLGPVRQFLGDVLPFLTQSRATYGDAFRLRMLNLEMTCLFGDDALALLEAGSCLRTSQSMHVLDAELQSCLPSTFDGPQHKMFRRAHLEFMTASLESKRRDDIQSRLAQHTAAWRAGDRVDVLHEAQVQTVDVLSVILNGEPLPFSKRELALVVHTLIWATFGHAPKWMLHNPMYRSVQRRMRAHMLGLVARIRANPERAASTLVGRYLDLEPPTGRDRWEDGDLAAVPFSAYLAGFDTVASASSFLLYQLVTHPEHLEQVRREHDELARESEGAVAPVKQKYLRAAFLEAVRLNPPGTAVLRVADRDFEFAGYTIRKGDEVLVVIAADHLNEAFFPRPTEFDPTRFLSENSAPLKRRVLPFGSGNHRCTGAVLGELVAVEMVSHWVNTFDLQVVPAGRRVRAVARPFTQPDGLRVEVVARRERSAAGAT
ncbi:MAG: cytochrome P450 [Myxococcales bacterium]|nr:cytochrome P450 [Myxococcales bacterium]MCB9629561.1 cytochrome P450 [Sandaracinaceae bacterium]